MVWMPGQFSPPHAHDTWCAYAVAENTLTETRIRVRRAPAARPLPSGVPSSACRATACFAPAGLEQIHRLGNAGAVARDLAARLWRRKLARRNACQPADGRGRTREVIWAREWQDDEGAGAAHSTEGSTISTSSTDKPMPAGGRRSRRHPRPRVVVQLPRRVHHARHAGHQGAAAGRHRPRHGGRDYRGRVRA